MNLTVNFKNILSEMESKKIKLCFVNQKYWFIVDNQNNLYQMETYWVGSYLDKLINEGITVNFHQVENSISKNIGDWQKEIRGVSEVEDFIKRQSLYWN